MELHKDNTGGTLLTIAREDCDSKQKGWKLVFGKSLTDYVYPMTGN